MKMNRLSLLILFGIPAVAIAQPIDFSPHYETSLEDGVSMRRMYFRCGATRIYFRPAGSWEISGTLENIVFRDKDLGDGSVKFENSHGGTANAFDAAGLENYRKVAYGLLPNDASNVKAISETSDAVEINDWKGFEIFFSYSSHGKQYKRSTLFIRLDREREVRVTIESQPENFEELHAALVRSLARWYEEVT